MTQKVVLPVGVSFLPGSDDVEHAGVPQLGEHVLVVEDGLAGAVRLEAADEVRRAVQRDLQQVDQGVPTMFISFAH